MATSIRGSFFPIRSNSSRHPHGRCSQEPRGRPCPAMLDPPNHFGRRGRSCDHFECHTDTRDCRFQLGWNSGIRPGCSKGSSIRSGLLRSPPDFGGWPTLSCLIFLSVTEPWVPRPCVLCKGGNDAACTMRFVMPIGLHRCYGVHHLHSITCSSESGMD
jgi:hypothetical protein